MRAEPVVIGGRFRGPPRSANGGYACGVIAAPLAGTVTVRLEYGANEKHETTREEFVFAHKRHGGLEVTARRAAT